jgi:hypothetical protein
MAGPRTTTPAPEATPTAAGGPADTPEVTSTGGKFVVSVAADDGEVTFTRPGVEEFTFTVADGKISTTKERAEWLVNYAGANPVPEKE